MKAYVILGLQTVISLIHNAWLLLIYVISLVLSTFWTQDIFDHLMAKKIKEIKLNVVFNNMGRKEILIDLISRAVVIVVYLIAAQVVCACVAKPIAAFVEIMTQALLISFYCFEYKSAAEGVDTPTGLILFEKQWVYQMGFGFSFALT